VLAQRLLKTKGIPWLPTDVLRTVLRRVLPELDAVVLIRTRSTPRGWPN
jgi:hypothetical protein